MRQQLELPAPSRQTLLDPSTTLLPGDLALVGARNGEDAERILCAIALDVAPARDILIVTPNPHEMTLVLLSIITGLPTDAIGREMLASEIARVREASRRLGQEPISLIDAVVYQGRADEVGRWLEEHPGGAAIVPAAWPASFGRDEDGAADFVRSLKAIARETGGSIVIPWRLNSHVRNDPRPMLRDLAVSGAAEDDADLIMLVHDREDGIEIRIEKNRHGPTGYVWDSREQPHNRAY